MTAHENQFATGQHQALSYTRPKTTTDPPTVVYDGPHAPIDGPEP